MLPKMILVRQNNKCSEEIQNIEEELKKAIENIKFDGAIFKDKRIGIAVGSRGISHEADIVKSLVSYIKENGGIPVIFAAMGCHGEASAKGQREMLESLGFTEDAMNCRIETCADSELIGKTDRGFDVYANTLVKTFDQIILINRIKMHTDFSDITESGLIKLCAIGIGNPDGCKRVHTYALRYGYGEAIRSVGLYMIKNLPIVLGIAITENWKHELDSINAVRPLEILSKEIELLAKVKEQNIKLPVEEADALIVGEIGKNISGTGMDTKIVGRIRIVGQKEPESPVFKRVGVLELSEASHGNAIGIGLADYAPISMINEINLRATTINGWSSMCPEQAGLPCFTDNDYEVFAQSIQTCGLDDPLKAHLIYIQNTNMISEIAVSEALYYDELIHKPDIEKISEPFELKFDVNGKILTKWHNGQLDIFNNNLAVC